MKNATMISTTSIDRITEEVINSGDRGATHPRLHEIYASLVRHLHDFVRDVKLTQAELMRGRDFINRASHHTQEIPDGEIHMLLDLLGISELVELLQETNRGVATESNLEGPLYVPNPPERQMGDRLGIDEAGDPLFLAGYVLDLRGQPIVNAIVDVWQGNSKGLYDIQDDSQPRGNFRGYFRTNSDGKYAFETVIPLGYQVPSSGPCGEALRLLGRHPWRAAHIHIKLSAPGFVPLTTQLFIDGDPYLESDTTFAVRTAILQLQKQQVNGKHFYTSDFNFILQPDLEQYHFSKLN
jgi:hydroxyquinol 1,2-dioxygenase